MSALTSRYRVDGAIVVSVRLSRQWLAAFRQARAAFRQAGMPLVAIDVTLAGVPHTAIDNITGGRIALLGLSTVRQPLEVVHRSSTARLRGPRPAAGHARAGNAAYVPEVSAAGGT